MKGEGSQLTLMSPRTVRALSRGLRPREMSQLTRMSSWTVRGFRAVTDVLLFEVSTPELEDVVRLEDDYGREGTSDK